MAAIHFDLRSILLHASASSSSSSPSYAAIRSLFPNLMFSRAAVARHALSPAFPAASFRLRAFSSDAVKIAEKPPICTADELHYVSVPSSDWKLALWRYHPPPKAPKRNHPLLLLSGVGTNAIGYDLSPESSFARYMSGQGFDTWILEVRGAGLSVLEPNTKEIEHSALEKSEQMEAASNSATNGALRDEEESNNGLEVLASESSSVGGESINISAYEADTKPLAMVWDESVLVTRLTETFMRLTERLSGFLSEGQSKIMSAKFFDQISKLLADSQLSERFNEIREKFLRILETRQNAGITAQIRDLSQGLVNIIEEGQRSVSPPLFNLQEQFTSTLEDLQKQLDLIVKYDWDFDHYLEEDMPSVMEYIRAQTKPKDGKLLAIGHSMGGILLYAMLSRYGFQGRDPNLAAVVTLASSLDYTSSKSSLKMLLPLADPALVLNVPVVPLGAMLTAAYPLSSRPPYVLSWLNNLISAENMMEPELLKKLVLNNFSSDRHDQTTMLGTIPAKLILQLTSAFKKGGLRDRSGTFYYKNHLHESTVPVLAIAGDLDLICPPEAVEETAKLFPKHLVTYKVFGEPDGPHYAHYDLVGGRLAVEQLYPCVIEFLSVHDKA